MGFIKRGFDFLVRPTQSRTMGILIFFVLVAVTSLTVYVAQQQQQLKQRAQSVNYCSIDPLDECSSTVAQAKKERCDTYPDYKCKIINGNEYKVYGCQ